MRGADAADRSDRRRVVQHDTAAAIDLEIDEARRQESTGEVDDFHASRKGIVGNDRFDDAVGDEQRLAVVPILAVEDAGAADCKGHGFRPFNNIHPTPGLPAGPSPSTGEVPPKATEGVDTNSMTSLLLATTRTLSAG
jgi:hypothetical protein